MSTSDHQIRVLGIGLDPHSAASASMVTDGNELQKQLQASLDALANTPNLEMETCWVYVSDPKNSQRVKDALKDQKYDAVLIGWGVRGFPEYTALLEDCIDAVRKAAPLSTRLIFGTSQHDHLETILRSFPELRQQ